jgi:4-hydroxy-3-polyprenylbenzoate decarboxylase
VDAAGVHPLLLAAASERYVPFAGERIPQELLTCGFSLLGNTQTSLSKYLLIAAREDDPALSCRNTAKFLRHVLERTRFTRDLHCITRTTMDTLDYSGISLNQGSKLLWAAAGRPLRRLATELPANLKLPDGFSDARMVVPGIAVCKGPRHTAPRDAPSDDMERLAGLLAQCLPARRDETPPEGALPEELALFVVADDPYFAAASWDNFLWVAFTRSDPATDLYGPHSAVHCKHWGCAAPLVMDARMKSFHAPPLEEDQAVERRIDTLAVKGGPLAGLA